jgi:hypothetical protein
MNAHKIETLPLSDEDAAILNKLKAKSWKSILRLYLPLFLFLGYLYYRMMPGNPFRGHYLSSGKMTRAGYDLVYTIFAVVFGGLFLFFAMKDYRRLIRPFHRELAQRNKYRLWFEARKYLDPLYGKCLLFYPDKENLYIQVNKDDFESIGDGEELRLEVAAVTGEVLSLRSGRRDFYQPEEFSFGDR